MDIDLDSDILAHDRYVRSRIGVSESFASVAKTTGTELEDRLVGVKVEGFGNHDVEVAVSRLSRGFRGYADDAEVEFQEGEDVLRDCTVLDLGHS